MIGIGRTPVPLRAFYVAMLVVLYLPIGLLFVFSFNDATSLSFPLAGFTTEWYGSVLGNGPMLAAARNSLVVGIASATLATAVGALVALAILRFSFRGRRLLLAMAGLPLLVPYGVLGVAFFLLFVTIDVPRSLLTVTVGHTVIAIPFATLILLARISGIDPTFPVFLYGQLRFAQRLPILIAGAVLLMLGTIALTLLITRLQARRAD
jgi:spermidine/putrescine transport system permease protein